MKKTLFAVLLAGSAVFAAADSYPFALDQYTARSQTKGATAEVKDGVLTCSGAVRLQSKQKFPVDPAKKYRVSFEVRSVAGVKEATLSVGFVPIAANGKNIVGMFVCRHVKGYAVLAADVKKGDTTVKITPDADSAGWERTAADYNLAVGAKKDLSDLPNERILFGIVKNELEDGVRTLTLRRPADFDAKAGTAVRLHRGGGDFMYTTQVRPGKFSAEWEPRAGTVSGPASDPKATAFTGWRYTAWPESAAFCQVLVLANWIAPEAKVEIRNLKLDILP